MSNFEGKVILVTGASGAIGSVTARLLAEAGAKLALTDLRQSQDPPAGAIFVPADVTDEANVAAMVARVVDHFGRLDGASNNAGVEQCGKPIVELDAADWERVMRINAKGLFLCVKHQLRAIVDGGSIVNTASGLGQIALPNAAEYIASKAAVIGFTRAAAVEAAPRGTRVNAILPGAVNTEMFRRLFDTPENAAMGEMIRRKHPLGRLAEVQEIGSATKWLLSDESRFVTGTAIPIDGGYTAV